ncbi:MAG: hypothetical protein HGB12_16245 [Bacteroidetes bacterium]|nr:hypothetical protein [Bacteroidota bacterium]
MKTKKILKVNNLVKGIIYVLIAFNFSLSTFNCFAQGGVAINTTGDPANSSAMLDISGSTQGVLIPSVALTSTTTASPVTSPANSLLIYNTATQNDVTPGFYYWVTDKWVSMLSSSTGWLLTGNTATTAGTNFIGSTDSRDVVFKSKNNEILRVKTDSNVVITGQIYTTKHVIP